MTELVASFIGVSQQPGDKGQLKCHNVYILPVRRCKRMKRDRHSIICAEKLKYSRGWMEADMEDEGEEEEGGGWGLVL